MLMQVGGFFFLHRNDLKKISKPWLKFTEDVRFDPEVRTGMACIVVAGGKHCSCGKFALG